MFPMFLLVTLFPSNTQTTKQRTEAEHAVKLMECAVAGLPATQQTSVKTVYLYLGPGVVKYQ